MKSVNIISGPPGSGKTTIGESLGQGCDYISVGRISRQEFAKNSDIGKKMLGYINSKIEYPAGLIDEIIRPHIIASDNNILLDGFPKYEREIDVLENIIKEEELIPGSFFDMIVSKEELARRIESRMICRICDFQSDSTFICPNCKTELSKRFDDNKNEYLVRIDDYYLNRDIIREGVRKLGFKILELVNENLVDADENNVIVKNEIRRMPE